MIDKFKENRKAAILIVSAMGILLLAATLQACQVDDLVKVDVPADVAAAIDIDERIPYSESDDAWKDWEAWVTRQSERFARSIDDGARIAGVLRSLSETGLAVGQEAASTLPGGALLSTGLALLGGLFLRKPGTDREIREEKQDSYNAGIERGRAMAEEALEVLSDLREAQKGDETTGD